MMICKAFLFKLIIEQILSLNVCYQGPGRKKTLKRISNSGSIYSDTNLLEKPSTFARVRTTIITFFNTEAT